MVSERNRRSQQSLGGRATRRRASKERERWAVSNKARPTGELLGGHEASGGMNTSSGSRATDSSFVLLAKSVTQTTKDDDDV